MESERLEFSPLHGYRHLPPLPNELAEDGKSFVNEQTGIKSDAYDRFEAPITNDKRGGWDIHIYYDVNDETEYKYARELWERTRREFPELRVYKIWDKAIGPHPKAMFEVNVFDPHQFGAFVSWLAILRGNLSALIHPNTDDEYWDHTTGCLWFGEKLDLKLDILKPQQ